MTKQKFITVLQYTLGVLGASLGLLLLDFLQTTSKELYVLPAHFWGRLLGLTFIYLTGAYLVVFFGRNVRSNVFWQEQATSEE